MEKWEEILENANAEGIGEMAQKAVARYEELFPGWEIKILSLEKSRDRNEQIDRIIALLDNMKEQKNP